MSTTNPNTDQFRNLDAVLAAMRAAASYLVPVADDDHSPAAELRRATEAYMAACYAFRKEGRDDLARRCWALFGDAMDAERELTAAR